MHVGAAWGWGGVLWMSVDKGIPPTSPSDASSLNPTIKWRNQTEAIQELKKKIFPNGFRTETIPWWLRWSRWSRICLQCGRLRFNSWVRKIPWRREWLSTPVFLPGEFHGQRNLVSFSWWGLNEWDTTEQLTCSLSLGVRADILEATE